jgi:hypothetical protein
MKTFYGLLLLCFLAAPELFGDDKSVITVHGFVDGYYAWNDNSPDNHENFVPGTGTTAKRANEFNLNLAAIDIVHDAGPAWSDSAILTTASAGHRKGLSEGR